MILCGAQLPYNLRRYKKDFLFKYCKEKTNKPKTKKKKKKKKKKKPKNKQQQKKQLPIKQKRCTNSIDFYCRWSLESVKHNL
jgi:hypothetical protein